jgi:hypothetical protein
VAGDYTNPILKPAAAEQVKRLGELSLAGNVFPDPDNQCLQNPVPYLFWNFFLRLIQLPDKVVFLYSHDDDFRQVPLNRPHPTAVIPSIHGDSVAHYEGDTLVVDTTGLNDKTFIDNYRTPHTEKLHVQERWKLINDGNMLEVNIRVEDPDTFNEPWSTVQRYRRVQPRELGEEACAENNYGLFDYHIPVADKPDF